MTTPTVIPSKAKTWVGLAGSVLAFAVPLIVSVEDYLPAPWPAVIGGVLAALTALGIYHAPYKPADTVIVPSSQATPPAAPDGGYQSPWPKP